MCGIFGYIGPKDNAASIVLEGLKRLEYRGYDSWGIGVIKGGKIYVTKNVGAIGDLNEEINLPKSSVGVAHTRWATHGGVNEINAHPHYSSDGRFILAQNGIVENYQTLKEMLRKKGYEFKTQTDTEVIVRLVEDKLRQTTTLKNAVCNAFKELEGRNTVIILTTEGEILAARNGSPLVVGQNGQAEGKFISSDTLSFAPFAKKMVVVDNGQLVVCAKESLNIFNIKTGKEVDYEFEDITLKSDKVDKEGYPHFMLKEIHDGPYVIKQLVNQDKKAYQRLAKAIKKAGTVYTIGSGTAGVAAAQIAFYLRTIAHIRAINLVGADAFDYYALFNKSDLIIAPSQSGETADVLEVLEVVKKKGVKIASFVNMPGSMMTKISDYKFMAQAGPEICVMSTKIFVSQIAWGYLVAKTVDGRLDNAIQDLKKLYKVIEKYLKNNTNHEDIKSLVRHLQPAKDIFLLAKYQNLQIIREGMIKLMEGTYKHAHAIPAGDLKHYAITLIQKGTPVIAVFSRDAVTAEVINAINEVKTRGAEVIGVGPENHESFDYFLSVPDTGETSAILNIIPLQLLAYYLTVELGNNVDKPRNIAKSVTVK